MKPEPTTSELLDLGEEAWVEAAFRTGDFAQAQRLLDAALERARREGDRDREAKAKCRLGLLRHYENIGRLMQGLDVSARSVDAEEALFREALELQEATGDVAGSADSLFGLGLVFQVLRHDWSLAMPFFWRALEIVENLADEVDLYTRSEVHRHVGFYFVVEDVRPEEAVHHLQRSLDLRQQLADPRRIPAGLQALGEAELAAGNRERATELLQRAVLQARQAGLLEERVQYFETTLQEARAALGHEQG